MTSFEQAMEGAPEVIMTTETHVSCDGGGGALGHPKTFYYMGDDDFVVCGYCDRVYILVDGKRDPNRT